MLVHQLLLQIMKTCDVICPFYYIRKEISKQLWNNLSRRKYIEEEWKSFQLDLTISELTAETYHDYLIKRKNLPLEQVNGMLANINEMAKQSGLDYHLDQSIILNS